MKIRILVVLAVFMAFLLAIDHQYLVPVSAKTAETIIDNSSKHEGIVDDYRNVLYYQIPDTMYASNIVVLRDTAWPSETYEADATDDINPTGEGWLIDSVVTWFWNWGGWQSWSYVPNIHFIVYPDNGGQPADSPMVELVIDQGTYTTYEYSQDRYRVVLPFPSPVGLDTQRYWIEVQPTTDCYLNGYTGILRVSYGNGQEFYFRSQLLGYPTWTTATNIFGVPDELGFMLYGTVVGEYRDVGVEEIISPPSWVFIDSTVYPTAIFRNHGSVAASFNVHFVIDSCGSNIYHEIQYLDLTPGTDTTVQFPNWTAGPAEGIEYAITAYTVWPEDENPLNDTVVSTTTTVGYVWKMYDDMPKNTYDNALVFTDATGVPEVYSLGGRGAYGEVFTFDCDSETWATTIDTLLIPIWAAGAAVVHSKIYVLGGYQGMTTFPVYFNQEYDPVTGTVLLKPHLPGGRACFKAVIWQDTLVYVIGGRDSNTVLDDVDIYDPYTNMWVSATPLPVPRAWYACGISGDTIFIAGSDDYSPDFWLGIISPSNPQVIQWIQGPDIPTGPSGQPGRASPSGAVCEGRFYFTGGYDHGYHAKDTWFYDPADNTWRQAPDKPTAMYSGGAVYVPVLDGGTFFCAGGEYNNAGVYATEGLTNMTFAIKETKAGEINSNNGFVAMQNPLQTNTDITYSITTPGNVTLRVFDIMGRVVAMLVDRMHPAGYHTVHWNVSDLSNGVYFLHLQSGSQSAVQKAVVIQ